ncbi:MAG: TerC family protein [Chloroflexi bacterium]|nr:TerC family protein [Chloroflexota bacterium]
MEILSSADAWIALLTLTVMEIVLGVDNVIFLSILAGKLPQAQQKSARQTGLGMALIMRILLLLSISWIASLTKPLFNALSFEISGRDLILLAGGLFLLGKATYEIHERLEGEEHKSEAGKRAVSFTSVIVQIALLDIVFSLDSVLTAIGMSNQLLVMVAAVIIAVGVMLWASGPISDFVNDHPTVKMLALSFLLLIGFSLVVEALHFHIPKGYIYFAMGFSVLVEALNLRASAARRKKAAPSQPVHLRQPGYAPQEAEK